jgi:hypothetical protein
VSGDARLGDQESSVLSPLADQLGELSLTLQHQTGLQDTLDAIVEAARDIVPGVQHASLSSVTVVTRSRLELRPASWRGRSTTPSTRRSRDRA